MKPTGPKRSRATPDAIVAAARRIARSSGWNAVTIRALADALGYASPILYEHFGNKGEVVAAAARIGFDLLAAELKAVAPPIGSDERIVALGVAYVAFAQREPELYQAMHGLDGVTLDPEALAAGAWQVCEIAAAELARWAEAQSADLPDPLVATEILWCLVHGIASLTLIGRIEPGRVEGAIKVLLRGWRS